MKEKLRFSKINLEDVPRLHELAIENGGNDDLSENNFNHWYIKNPVKSNSLWKVECDGVIEGYATTNNFIYSIDNNDYLVALPQNVLTSTKVRGKGLFGKLYFKTEVENLEDNKVDFFLTSTGHMSTPIFLNKFDYIRGKSPAILVKVAGVPALFSKKKYKLLENVDSIQFKTNYNLDNARKKDIKYFKWRYSECDKKNLRIISILENDEIIGYAFLIIKRKFGVKVLIIADIISDKKENISSIVDVCHVFATKNLFVAMVMFELSCYCRRKGFNLSIRNRFNFLVKGKNMEETARISKIDFNFFFGDLDYFW